MALNLPQINIGSGKRKNICKYFQYGDVITSNKECKYYIINSIQKDPLRGIVYSLGLIDLKKEIIGCKDESIPISNTLTNIHFNCGLLQDKFVMIPHYEAKRMGIFGTFYYIKYCKEKNERQVCFFLFGLLFTFFLLVSILFVCKKK